MRKRRGRGEGKKKYIEEKVTRVECIQGLYVKREITKSVFVCGLQAG